MPRIYPALGVILVLVTASALRANDAVDREVIHRIKQEVFDHTDVMDHLFHLVEVYGPRITNSPGFDASAKWASSRLEEWGAENVKLESWGPFGQGWSRSYFSAHLVEPQYEMLIGVPLGWSPSTDGYRLGDTRHRPFREAIYSQEVQAGRRRVQRGIQRETAGPDHPDHRPEGCKRSVGSGHEALVES